MRIISFYIINQSCQFRSASCYILQIVYKYEVLGLAISNDNDYLDASYML